MTMYNILINRQLQSIFLKLNCNRLHCNAMRNKYSQTIYVYFHNTYIFLRNNMLHHISSTICANVCNILKGIMSFLSANTCDVLFLRTPITLNSNRINFFINCGMQSFASDCIVFKLKKRVL